MSVTYGPKLGKMINALVGDPHAPDFRALLRAWDQLVQANVKSMTLAAPPGSPANGDAYIVAASPTGAWAGKATQIAAWTTDDPATPGGYWQFFAPNPGFLVFNIATVALFVWTGSAWAPAGGGATIFTQLTDVPAAYTGAGGYEVEVNAGATALVFNPKPFDVSLFVPGLPTAGATVLRFVFTRAVSFPASLTGSLAGCGIASTGAKVFTLNKNGSAIGSVNIAAAAVVATFTFASAVSFAGGDILTVVAPTPQDATLADFFMTLLGTRV
jgi:hypothetical protein